MIHKVDAVYPISAFVAWRPCRYEPEAAVCRAQHVTDELLKDIHARYVLPVAVTAELYLNGGGITP